MKRLILFLVAVALATGAHAQTVRPGEWVVRRADDGAIGEKELGELKAYGVHGLEVFARYDRVMGVRTDSRGAELLRQRGFDVEPNYEFRLPPSEFTPAGKADAVPWHLIRIAERAKQGPVTGLLPPTSTAVFIFDTYAYDGNGGQVFGNRLVRGPDFVGGPDTAIDCRLHGTAVASAVHDVNPSALIISIRVASCDKGISWLAEQAASDWLLDTGMKAYGAGPINKSYGGLGYTSNPLTKVDTKLRAAGFIIVAAAGNDDTDAATESPCRYADLCVGASQQDDSRASFSNFGANVDLFAPGQDISFVGPDGNEWSGSGTSASAPLTAGVWTLLHGAFPTLSPSRIRALLVANATKGVLSDVGTASPNRLLYAGNVVEVPETLFFRYFKSQKKFVGQVNLTLNGGATLSGWVDFYKGLRGPNGKCQGVPYARGTLVNGLVTVTKTGWPSAPGNACFATELGLVSDRRVVVLP